MRHSLVLNPHTSHLNLVDTIRYQHTYAAYPEITAKIIILMYSGKMKGISIAAARPPTAKNSLEEYCVSLSFSVTAMLNVNYVCLVNITLSIFGNVS